MSNLDRHPLGVIRRAKELGIRRVLVGVSGGKDSLVCLSLCCEHFEEVQPYFMYLVELDFQLKYLAYIERKFSADFPSSFRAPIIKLPHWMLTRLLRSSSFRLPTKKSLSLSRNTGARDIDAYLRKKTGIEWIATGEKAMDSVERNALIRAVGGLSETRRRFWPLATWNNAAVFNLLKLHQIALPTDYSNALAGGNGSFGGLFYRDIAWIESRYPEDWRKLCEFFPLLPAQIVRWRERERKEQKLNQEPSDGQ